MFSVHVTGKGEGLKKLKELLNKQNFMARAGVLEETYNRDGVNIAEYAIYNEKGYPGHPPRPFMQQTVDREKANWKAKLQIALHKQVLKAEQAMEYMGRVMVEDIRDTLNGEGKFEPLKEETVKRKQKKGSPFPDAPLVDTLDLFHGLKHDVIRGGGNGRS